MRQTVIVVSDGTGRTAHQALDAALAQFPNIQVDTIMRSELRLKEQIQAIVKEAKKYKAFILHTIVKEGVRNELIRVCRQNHIETIDLMGPLLSRLKQQFDNISPTQKPGLFHNINKEYFKRIDSIQFALKHDDGMRANELAKAELVFLGVSRTFKTPLSVYFAYKGWFVANIPMVLGIAPPNELFKIDPQKVFCLTTTPRRLSTLRKFRVEYLGNQTGNYADIKHVQEELFYAESLFKNNPKWNMIKVTGKSIEEIASEIMAIYKPEKL